MRDQLYTAVTAPVGEEEGWGTVEGFFMSYMALPVVIIFWICGYFWKGKGWLRTSEIDVDSGRRELDWDEINAYREEIKALSTWKRLMHKVF